jgi:2,3-bisphosphoglycerate-independent phosphoglycerate mutase
MLLCSRLLTGENEVKDDYNAINIADTPCTDALKEVPGRWRTIRAHGTAVGLPTDDDMWVPSASCACQSGFIKHCFC